MNDKHCEHCGVDPDEAYTAGYSDGETDGYRDGYYDGRGTALNHSCYEELYEDDTEHYG